METYARELVPRLAAREDLRVTCLVNRETAGVDGPWGKACPMEVVPVRASNRIEWVRGEQQYVPRIASRIGTDLIHSLGSTSPFWGRVPRVTTIHDLNYLLVPEAHFGLRGLGMRALIPGAARCSRRVIVDAASTREDLRRHLRIDPAKVDVVPLAAAPPGPVTPTPAAALRERLGLADRSVLLSPGAKRPHKNLATVLQALARMDAAVRPVLVATGYRTPYEEELWSRAAALGVSQDLVMPPRLDAADLEGLFALATLVVFVSRYEGFGLPVLEAMVRGVPVVAANTSALPEVAGDAAVLVDPEDPGALAGVLGRLLADADERAQLAESGRERAAGFTWERSAELTAASYVRAVQPAGLRSSSTIPS